MPYYPQEIIEQIREGNDIVGVVSQYVHLTAKSGRHFGLCPFHREKTPSFSVSEDTQFYHCFGCGESGNVYTFIQKIENYSFPEAVKYLAERIHFTLPEPGANAYKSNAGLPAQKEKLYEIHKKAARFFYDTLISEEGRPAADYLDKRGVSPAARKKFGLGYSSRGNGLYKFLSGQGYGSDILTKSGLLTKGAGGFYDKFAGRLMFPIFDSQNRVVGFGGRIIEESAGKSEPKYLNSPETAIFTKSRNLYSINYARKEKTGEIILTEGYMDVIALYQYGFRNAVAALGTAFNQKHAIELKKYCKTIILLFDSDEAGRKALLKAIETLRGSGLSIKAPRLEGAKDPDEFLRKFGTDEFARALKDAPNDVEYRINDAKNRYDLSKTDERAKFANEAGGIIKELDNKIERDAYIKEVAKIAGIEEKAIKDEIEGGAAGFDIPNMKQTKNYRNAASNKKNIDDARRHILYELAARNVYGEFILKNLHADELVTPVYVKLFEIIRAEREKTGSVRIPGLLDSFEDADEQRAVSSVFTSPVFYEDEKKAVENHINEIKTAYYDYLIEQENLKDIKDDNKITALYVQKREFAAKR